VDQPNMVLMWGQPTCCSSEDSQHVAHVGTAALGCPVERQLDQPSPPFRINAKQSKSTVAYT